MTAFREFMMLDVATCAAGEYVVVSVNHVVCKEAGAPPTAATAEDAQRILQPSPQPFAGGRLSCDNVCDVVLRFLCPRLISSATLECCSRCWYGQGSTIEWEVAVDSDDNHNKLGCGNFDVSVQSEVFMLTFDYPIQIEPSYSLIVYLRQNGPACFCKLSFF
eukprot:NODE_5521_length_575_cov_210.117308.p1 GENE.NODE_5521_length_575_cov_210.117308~~NODE_5521_length_575_cov_210.117308.p1  ORF type:complete len:177 (-),score=32.36 NODE_5521_length_575_cov_210.117308:28-513(-)